MILVQDLLENKQRQTEQLESMLELVKSERDLYVKLYRGQKALFDQFRKDIAELLNVPGAADDCSYLKVALTELRDRANTTREQLEKAHRLGEEHGGRQMEEDVDALLAEKAYHDYMDEAYALQMQDEE